MKYSLHPRKAAYINKISRQLLADVQKVGTEKPLQMGEIISSLQNRPAQGGATQNIDMGDMEAVKIYTRGYKGKYTGYEVVCPDMKITFVASDIETIYKLAGCILQQERIRETISDKFVFNAIIRWVVTQRHTPTQPGSELSDTILVAFENASKQYAIYYPIQHLAMEGALNVGLCTIEKASKEDVQAQVGTNPQKERLWAYWSVRQHTCARFIVEAEKEKALERAMREATLSVNTLKILFAGWLPADHPVVFDLDFKSLYQESNKVMIQPIDDPDDGVVTHARAYADEHIDSITVQKLTEAGLPVFHAFLEATAEKPGELQQLLRTAIGNYADAISYPHLHERVAKIFTVLESLLVPSDTVNILESLSRYLPKIISADPQERKVIVKQVKLLYGVRSAIVHHAHRRDFSLSALADLHRYARSLLLEMITQCSRWKEKQDMLNEIEERINAA